MPENTGEGDFVTWPDPEHAGASLARTLVDAHCRYAVHGPLVAQATRLRGLGGVLREYVRWLQLGAFELEIVDARVREQLGSDWWRAPRVPAASNGRGCESCRASRS